MLELRLTAVKELIAQFLYPTSQAPTAKMRTVRAPTWMPHGRRGGTVIVNQTTNHETR